MSILHLPAENVNTLYHIFNLTQYVVLCRYLLYCVKICRLVLFCHKKFLKVATGTSQPFAVMCLLAYRVKARLLVVNR